MYLFIFLNSVNGKVMGKKLNECLLKTGDQVILAPKIIKGSMHAPSLVLNGLVNGVNLTDLSHQLLKEHELVQIMKSKVIFKGNLQILGNLTVGGEFQGIESAKINSLNETFVPVMNAIAYLEPYASRIATAVKSKNY